VIFPAFKACFSSRACKHAAVPNGKTTETKWLSESANGAEKCQTVRRNHSRSTTVAPGEGVFFFGLSRGPAGELVFFAQTSGEKAKTNDRAFEPPTR
jgi:hypothetical protein